MNQAFSLLDLLIAVGIPSIIIGLVYIGSKMQLLESLNVTVDKMKTNLKVVSDFLINSSQPGIACFNISGSLSASQTFCFSKLI